MKTPAVWVLALVVTLMGCELPMVSQLNSVKDPANGGTANLLLAPSEVGAGSSAGQCSITWKAVTGATSYNLYWSTTAGVTAATGTKVTGVTSPYSHTGLTNGTAYYYVVTAVNVGGESVASSQTTATPQVSATGAPTGVSAASGNAANTVSWTAVTGATSYNLYWSTTAGVTTATGTKVTGVTSPYNHTGLTNGTAYYYVVTAVNAGGESAASNQASATPQVAVVAAPTGVSVTAGDAQASVSWSAVSGAASYNLYWSTLPGITPVSGTKVANATSPAVQTGLINGTTYYFIVTAVNAGGESVASTQVSTTPMAPPTVTLGSQSGTIISGSSGAATFSATTFNVTAGTTGTVTWYSSPSGTTPGSAPTGIAATVSTVFANAATVTMTATTSAAAGSYYFKLVEGATVSAMGTLMVRASTLNSSTLGVNFLAIDGGTFSTLTANITLSSYHLGQYDITQAQYATIMGTNPSANTGDTNRPVEMVTWFDAIEFCNKLSLADGKAPVYTLSGRSPATGYPITAATVTADFTANGYRLPTEMQWRWAAMGGVLDSKTGDVVGGVNTGGYNKAFSGSNGTNAIDSYAWYSGNSGNTTHAVGAKLPNELGLYDMSGNVAQWCWDWSGTSASGTDPVGPSSGTNRICCGGSYAMYGFQCAVSWGDSDNPFAQRFRTGFRVALP